MSYIEMQVNWNSIEIPVAFNFATSMSAAIGQQFSAGSSEYQVTNVQLMGAPQLAFDEPETVYVQWSDLVSQNNSGFQTTAINTKYVQIVQVIAVSLAQIVKNSNGNIVSSQAIGSFQFNWILGLNAVIDTGPGINQVDLLMETYRVDAQFQNPTLATEVINALDPFAPGSVQPVNIPNYALLNSGVAADPAKSKIMVLVEIGEGDANATPALWNRFYNNDFPDLLGGDTSWAILVDSTLVQEAITISFTAGLNQNADQISLQGGVSTKWAPSSNGIAVVDFGFPADVIGACKLATGSKNIQYDFTGYVTLTLAENAANTLQGSTEIHWDASNHADLIGCELLEALELGIFAGFLTLLWSPAAYAFGFGPAFVAGFIASVSAFSLISPRGQPVANCTPASAHQITCTYPLPFSFNTSNGMNATTLNVTTVSGITDGLVLSGATILSLLVYAPLSVRLRLIFAGRHLNGNGLSSLQSPMPSLIGYLSSLV